MKPIRVTQAEKAHHADPLCPAIAQQARVEWTAVIEATIGADGQVKNAHIIRSVPFLDLAALTAVREWRFTPTHVNGASVPVILTVTATFTLR